MKAETPYTETELLLAAMEDRPDDAATLFKELSDRELEVFRDQVRTLNTWLLLEARRRRTEPR